MYNYIKSEFYRITHSKGYYVFIAICSVLLISANVVLAAVKSADDTFQYATTEFSHSLFSTSMSLVFILCIVVATMVFSNEHGDHTLKNSVSYGISRGKIFFGKLIVEIVYSIIAFVIISGLDIASAFLLLENTGPNSMELLLKTSLAVTPLLILAVGVSNTFLFIFESTGAGIASICGILLALPIVSNLLGMKFTVFRKLSEVLPWNMLINLKHDFNHYILIFPLQSGNGYLRYWLVGMLELAIIALIGFMVFRRKEIK